MIPGGGKNKGSNAERIVGQAFSKWITKGERTDLFSRNVLSGGQFTRFRKKGNDLGQPGDLIANHPLAFPFLALYTVEVKHYADLQWEAFLYDVKRTSFLWKVIIHTRKQAEETKKEWFIVVKQNNKHTLIMMDEVTATRVFSDDRWAHSLRHHVFHSGAIHVLDFNLFLRHILPRKMIYL